MRVALVHNLPSGGAKRHTREQLRELSARGHHIVEFAPESADTSFASFTPYVYDKHIYPFVPTPSPRRVPLLTPYLSTWAGLRNLRRMNVLSTRMAYDIDAGNFDLVFAKDCQLVMNPFVLRHLKTRSVYQCHHGLRHRVESARATTQPSDSVAQHLKHLYYAPGRVLFDRVFRHVETTNIRSAGLVLTNSRFSQALITDNYRIPSQVIYPGIDTELFKPSPGPKAPYVLCVGALIYSKGYRFLVTALSRVPPAARPPLRIVANTIAVDEHEAVARLARDLAVQVEVETIRDDRHLVEVYSRASVFVYAPEQEALGMAPLEALACGTPVVAVAEGGVLETIVDRTTGVLVNRDPNAFAAALAAVLGDHQLHAQLAEAGVEHVRSHWTWSAAVDRLEEAFRTLKSV